MKITFYPSTNDADLIEAAKEYQNIWDADSDKIIDTYQKLSGLSFKTEAINAIVHSGKTYSHPLTLRSNLDAMEKRLTLVHELGHWLFVDNNIKFKDNSDRWLEAERQMFLILFDVCVELVGEKETLIQVEKDKKKRRLYIDSWEWALSFTKEERQHKFEELKKQYENN